MKEKHQRTYFFLAADASARVLRGVRHQSKDLTSNPGLQIHIMLTKQHVEPSPGTAALQIIIVAAPHRLLPRAP